VAKSQKQFMVDFYTTVFQSRSKRVNASDDKAAKKIIEDLPTVSHVTAVWECVWRKNKVLGED
jgi:hypothetical protein